MCRCCYNSPPPSPSPIASLRRHRRTDTVEHETNVFFTFQSVYSRCTKNRRHEGRRGGKKVVNCFSDNFLICKSLLNRVSRDSRLPDVVALFFFFILFSFFHDFSAFDGIVCCARVALDILVALCVLSPCIYSPVSVSVCACVYSISFFLFLLRQCVFRFVFSWCWRWQQKVIFGKSLLCSATT